MRALLDAVRIRPGEAILEVGPGSGVVLRELARRTAGANPIVGVDINRYLLREAAALVQRAGLADRISFQEGSAEAHNLQKRSSSRLPEVRSYLPDAPPSGWGSSCAAASRSVRAERTDMGTDPG